MDLAGIRAGASPAAGAGSTRIAPLGDCLGPFAEACAEYGRALAKGTIPRLDEQPGPGQGLEERACAAGSAPACHQLSWLLLTERSLDHDPERAVELLEHGFEDDLAEDCAQLGALYHVAIGVSLDPENALELQQRACSLGHSASCEGRWVLASP